MASRIQIQDLDPLVDCGRYASKACVDDEVRVEATIFRDGHELLRAALRTKPHGATRWRETPMSDLGNDRWAATFTPDRCGRWCYRIEAWVDPVASFQWELRRKVEGGQQDLASELAEGALLLDRETITVEEALAAEPGARLERTWSQTVNVEVDRERARFGSWYELFPRSWGGFAGVERQLPRLAELGFDVLYLPPIHPIGRTNRKGRNNTLEAGPADPGSPWAIGQHDLGGHDAIHPELGTEQDFRALCEAARDHGLEVALDFAIQCSADHPWLEEHPEWFNRRPDGTLKYAENPPKKYQDIYNVNWDSEDWWGLWQALLEIVEHWIDCGVTIFRVDNPHTKPTPFWEWLLNEVRERHPDVLFLAEAFTRRAKMQTLAKAGFQQSYTYFTWKSSRWELTEYIVELAYSEERHYFRPNFFINTTDILTEELQHGGRPSFEARLVLGATLGPTYGIYSGFENVENVPVRPGSEEYLDSEKYEIRRRSLDGPLLPLIARVNEVRRRHRALQSLDDVTFLDTANDALIGYAKRSYADIVLVIVNIDPRNAQEGVVVVPAELGVAPAFGLADQLSGDRFTWHLGRNYVRLEPGKSHLLAVDA